VKSIQRQQLKSAHEATVNFGYEAEGRS
jgi:hypothetical protein